MTMWVPEKTAFSVADNQIMRRRRNTRSIFTNWATTTVARTSSTSFKKLYDKCELTRCMVEHQ